LCTVDAFLEKAKQDFEKKYAEPPDVSLYRILQKFETECGNTFINHGYVH